MVFGLSIIKSATLDKLKDAWKTFRPDRGLRDLGSSDEGLVPLTPITYQEIQDLIDMSDVMQTIIQALSKEIFRNGGDFEEKFVKKCTNHNCGKEFDNAIEKCDLCGSEVREPDSSQLIRVKPLFDTAPVNTNKQTMLDVLEELENDLEYFDICFPVLIKDYYWDADGAVVGAEVKELIRGNPVTFRIIADQKGRIGYDQAGHEIKTCLIHRHKALWDQDKCPECGRKTYKAAYVSIEQQVDRTYYADSEVRHFTKYKKSLTYGWPRVISAYQKVLTLMHQDSVILDWYKGRRPPKGLLLVASRSWDSFTKAWSWLINKVKKNPNGIYPLSIETSGSKGGKLAEFISFMNTLEEMQYTQTREEMRRQIGGLYGVMPIFQADLSASGGLNNEGLQVTVTTRSALAGQEVFNKKIVPFILKNFGILDYKWLLNSPEEKDEMAELQREQLKITNAQSMLQMGYEVKYNEDGEFEFSGVATRPNPTIDFGGGFNNPMSNVSRPAGNPNERLDGSPGKVDKAMEEDVDLIIKAEIDEVEQELNQNVIMKATDLKDFLEKAIYGLAFKSMSVKQSDIIKSYLISKVGTKIGLKEIVNKIIDVSGVDEARAETIARTEFVNVLRNKAREYAYDKADPEGEYKYVWQGPKDNRTTKICKSISKKASKGVSMKELKEIIKKEADQSIYDESRPWTPHISCRHRITRKV